MQARGSPRQSPLHRHHHSHANVRRERGSDCVRGGPTRPAPSVAPVVDHGRVKSVNRQSAIYFAGHRIESHRDNESWLYPPLSLPAPSLRTTPQGANGCDARNAYGLTRSVKRRRNRKKRRLRVCVCVSVCLEGATSCACLCGWCSVRDIEHESFLANTEGKGGWNCPGTD